MPERRSTRLKLLEKNEETFMMEKSDEEWSSSEEDTGLEKEKDLEVKGSNLRRKQIKLITKPSESEDRVLQIKLKVSDTNKNTLVTKTATTTTTTTTRKTKKEEVITLPKDMDPEPVCPICLKIIIGDYDEINEHIDECIGPSSSLIQSGTCTPADITMEPLEPEMQRSLSLVNVDEDDFGFGKGQYSEEDIEMILKADALAAKKSKKSILNTNPAPSQDFSNLQNALKSLLDRLAAVPKCAVCWETLKMPAVASVNCWHVCCEGCWLRTLGTKKLCPHCSTITNPSDLRKVFF